MLGLTNVGNTPVGPCLTAVHEIHVLLVDHEPDSLFTRQMLEACRYRVTHVDVAATAVAMVSSNTTFDAVIANINSPDHLGYKVLEISVAKNLPIVLLSYDDNIFTTVRAIESGAILYVKKPVPMDMVKYLWQHVVREKVRSSVISSERELLSVPALNDSGNNAEFTNMDNNLGKSMELQGTFRGCNNNINNAFGGSDNTNNAFDGCNNINKVPVMANNDRGQGTQVNNGNGDEKDYVVTNRSMGIYGKKRKQTTWTNEIHARFVDAVEHLGPGRCFPKEILDLMNVPGLTRMQVASHLQKCRNQNKLFPKERKNQYTNQLSSSNSASQSRPQPGLMMRFGSMPHFLSRSSSFRATSENPPIHTKPDEPRLQNMVGSEPMDVESDGGVGAHNYAPLIPHQISKMNMMTHSASETRQHLLNPSHTEPSGLQNMIGSGPMNVAANGSGGAHNYGPLIAHPIPEMNMMAHGASGTHQHLLNPSHTELSGLQNMIGSGPINVAANGGVGVHNNGPMVPHEISTPGASGIHQHYPLNHILTPDDDFFNIPDVEHFIQNFCNSVLPASEGVNCNQNANNAENQWDGSDSNAHG